VDVLARGEMACMSTEALNWALRDPRVQATVFGPARGVLTALADHANGVHEAWPSLETLVAETGYKRSAVAQALAELEKYGLVQTLGYRQRTRVRRLLLAEQPTSLIRDESAKRNSERRPVADPSATSPRPVHVVDPNQNRTEPTDLDSPSSPVDPTRERRRATTSSEEIEGEVGLAEHVLGVLQRGVEGLTTDEPAKAPTRQAILGAIRKHKPTREDAVGIAIGARSIAQAHNRAPNIAGLYEQLLARHARRAA
jgi:hypothetical protein